MILEPREEKTTFYKSNLLFLVLFSFSFSSFISFSSSFFFSLSLYLFLSLFLFISSSTFSYYTLNKNMRCKRSRNQHAEPHALQLQLLQVQPGQPVLQVLPVPKAQISKNHWHQKNSCHQLKILGGQLLRNINGTCAQMYMENIRRARAAGLGPVLETQEFQIIYI